MPVASPPVNTGYMLTTRGDTRELDAFVVAAAWSGDTPAFALGDGRLVLAGWQDCRGA